MLKIIQYIVFKDGLWKHYSSMMTYTRHRNTYGSKPSNYIIPVVMQTWPYLLSVELSWECTIKYLFSNRFLATFLRKHLDFFTLDVFWWVFLFIYLFFVPYFLLAWVWIHIFYLTEEILFKQYHVDIYMTIWDFAVNIKKVSEY